MQGYQKLNILIRHCLCLLLMFGNPLNIFSQLCPPNIDFETGTFDNWTCYYGSVAAVGGQNVMTLYPSAGPIQNQHTMITSSQTNELDLYGGFPVLCPNGSGKSIRLGNDLGGGQAEGISYEFTIPAGQNVYSLIYHYAVVFQDPNHQIFQQPRLELEITNVSDGVLIDCSSFTFYPSGSLLPGFFISPIMVDSVNVWCKDWTAVSINLNGLAGKTIRLFFKTGDCTFTRHFGYAYLDVNTECSSEFVGATYCPDDTAVYVTAPYGYQNYTWYNNSFTQVLGSSQTIYFNPPPAAGTTIAVEVIPFSGYGCPDTLYALLIDTLTVIANAGRDTFACNLNPVQIGANAKPGYAYRWSPATGLSDPNIANPFANPLTNTQYVLTTSSLGGGCKTTDTVDVIASIIDTTLNLTGKPAFCITSNDSAVLSVPFTRNIQWYRENAPIPGATQPKYKVTQSGSYRVLLVNDLGCSISTDPVFISIESPVKGIRYPVQFAVQNIPIQLTARNIGIMAEWNPPSNLSNPSSFMPMFNGTADKEYTVSIATQAGCVTTDTQFIKIFKEVNLFVPTGFTPNGDGLNDFLKPIYAGIKELKYFRIYNRWGQLIFDLKSDPRGWDGTLGGKPMSSQAVVWMAEATGLDNKTYFRKGTTIIIR